MGNLFGKQGLDNLSCFRDTEAETEEMYRLSERRQLCFLRTEPETFRLDPFSYLFAAILQILLVVMNKNEIVHISNVVLDMQLFFNIMVEIIQYSQLG